MSFIGLDLDGTLVNYGDGNIVVNEELIDQFLKPGDEVVIVTNQGGVTLGYRTARNFVDRLMAVDRALFHRGLRLGTTCVSVFHPKATLERVNYVAHEMYEQTTWAHMNVYVHRTPESRKPGGAMLTWDDMACYIGDSDEDEAAAEAAGVSFVRVPRFIGEEK